MISERLVTNMSLLFPCFFSTAEASVTDRVYAGYLRARENAKNSDVDFEISRVSLALEESFTSTENKYQLQIDLVESGKSLINSILKESECALSCNHLRREDQKHCKAQVERIESALNHVILYEREMQEQALEALKKPQRGYIESLFKGPRILSEREEGILRLKVVSEHLYEIQKRIEVIQTIVAAALARANFGLIESSASNKFSSLKAKALDFKVRRLKEITLVFLKGLQKIHTANSLADKEFQCAQLEWISDDFVDQTLASLQ